MIRDLQRKNVLPLIDCLKTRYGLRVKTLTLLNLGADNNAAVYKAQTQDGSDYFLKVKPHTDNIIGIDILDFLNNTAIQGIILPVKTLEGQQTAGFEGLTLVVYPFVKGEDGFQRSMTDDQWVRLGKTLRQIHDLDIPKTLAQRIRIEKYSDKWREALRSFYARINPEPTGDLFSRNLLQLLKVKAAIVHQLVNQADLLAKTLQSESAKFVLCHSDIHGGNVLIDGESEIYLVDWDDPIMAPKERDLMYIGGGVGNVWNRPREESLFYKGYGIAEIDTRKLAYYRSERIIEDVVEYCQLLLMTNEYNKNREELFKHFKNMFEPRGVVDIALDTYNAI